MTEIVSSVAPTSVGSCSQPALLAPSQTSTRPRRPRPDPAADLPPLPPPPPAGPVQYLGDLIQRHHGAVAVIQWLMVVVYLVLVLVPPFLPPAASDAPWFHHLGQVAELLFWGLWWPGVVLSMLLLGQFWCGILCPDGTLTEFASRRGLARKVPEWMRWPALPLAAFLILTLYDHLIDAHRATAAAAVVIGGSTLLAVVTGAVYGKGKRVWCRYLCPASGVFSLLSRVAVLHFRVDRERWDRAPRTAAKAVDCPPLLDVRRLISNEKCNMCCRCSGHRGAVALAVRAPGSEIAGLADDEIRGWEALGILGILGGLLVAVAQWSGSWWHDAIAGVVADSGLSGQAPWWIAGSAEGPRTWGDGLALLLALLAATAALTLAQGSALLIGALGDRHLAIRLAYALIPLAGLGLLLSSLEHALGLAGRIGWTGGVDLIPGLRLTLLTAGGLWSTGLGWRLAEGHRWRTFATAGVALSAAILIAAYASAPLSTYFHHR